MQSRMMEEKSKVIEMMNQANEVYESVSKFGSQSDYQPTSKMSIMYPPDSGFGQDSSVVDMGSDIDGRNFTLIDYEPPKDYDNIPNRVDKKLIVHE